MADIFGGFGEYQELPEQTISGEDVFYVVRIAEKMRAENVLLKKLPFGSRDTERHLKGR